MGYPRHARPARQASLGVPPHCAPIADQLARVKRQLAEATRLATVPVEVDFDAPGRPPLDPVWAWSAPDPGRIGPVPQAARRLVELPCAAWTAQSAEQKRARVREALRAVLARTSTNVYGRFVARDLGSYTPESVAVVIRWQVARLDAQCAEPERRRAALASEQARLENDLARCARGAPGFGAPVTMPDLGAYEAPSLPAPKPPTPWVADQPSPYTAPPVVLAAPPIELSKDALAKAAGQVSAVWVPGRCAPIAAEIARVQRQYAAARDARADINLDAPGRPRLEALPLTWMPDPGVVGRCRTCVPLTCDAWVALPAWQKRARVEAVLAEVLVLSFRDPVGRPVTRSLASYTRASIDAVIDWQVARLDAACGATVARARALAGVLAGLKRDLDLCVRGAPGFGAPVAVPDLGKYDAPQPPVAPMAPTVFAAPPELSKDAMAKAAGQAAARTGGGLLGLAISAGIVYAAAYYGARRQ